MIRVLSEQLNWSARQTASARVSQVSSHSHGLFLEHKCDASWGGAGSYGVLWPFMWCVLVSAVHDVDDKAVPSLSAILQSLHGPYVNLALH